MNEQLDCVVIGAGVVGLAVARALAMRGREVVVLEAANAIGTGTSSRNSEVIHAGIYYPAGSLKASLCVRGREQLYAYCRERGVAHRQIGKVIVATTVAELPTLAKYLRAARVNGVLDLEELDQARVRELEPAVQCAGGLLSPSTGIVDSHSLMLAYRGDVEAHGGFLAFASPLLGGAIDGATGGASLHLEIGGSAPVRVKARCVVNSAGLAAPAVARSFKDFPRARIPQEYFARGHYFVLNGRSPFHRLVYPTAEPGGLGVHVTLDLAGRVRFGPDVQWINGIDYTFDAARKEEFIAAIRRYYPALDAARVEEGYTGIRPKISGPAEPAADFMISGPADHGVPGLVNLFGIESPGLTASLAIAENVADLLH
jgi:L-2-hydroxyglutarate oxidase LhgO